MSEESLKRRLREAGYTDLSPEGMLKTAIEKRNPKRIESARKHLETMRTLERETQEIISKSIAKREEAEREKWEGKQGDSEDA